MILSILYIVKKNCVVFFEDGSKLYTVFCFVSVFLVLIEFKLFVFFSVQLIGFFSGFFFILGVFLLLFSMINFIALKWINLKLVIYYIFIISDWDIRKVYLDDLK